MNWQLYINSRKGRLLQIVAAVAAVIIFFTAVSQFQTGDGDTTTHRSNVYLEEYGCGVHVEVRFLLHFLHFFSNTHRPAFSKLFLTIYFLLPILYSAFAAKMSYGNYHDRNLEASSCLRMDATTLLEICGLHLLNAPTALVHLIN
jgi:hypothetical protein